ncbi:MAG: TIGR03936 family radical SAM-associated protein [Planctomycetota bacterium]|nr:TIGR03936 family radical SAM-associated protein [Planctomycetota bacterium]
MDRTRLLHKVRLWFARDEVAAFHPHQAVMNAFSRGLRIAGIPVRLTEGYNVHPRVAIPYALSVGIAGEGEVLEIELCDWMRPSVVSKKLNESLPRGLRITKARLVPPRRAAFVVTGALYRATIQRKLLESAKAGAKKLIEAEKWNVVRQKKKKTRKRDIRPFVEEITFDGQEMMFRLKVTRNGTAKPIEIVAAVLNHEECEPRLVPVFKLGMEIKNAD